MTPELSRRAAKAMQPLLMPEEIKTEFVKELITAKTFDKLPQRAKDIILLGERNADLINGLKLPKSILEQYSYEENRALPSNYRPASEDDVPQGKNCGNCGYYGNGYCDFWDAEVKENYYCNKWEGEEEDIDEEEGEENDEEYEDDDDEAEEDMRAVAVSAPVFMRAAARRGLKFHEEGHSGDGLLPQTVEDARKMMNGQVSEQKWRKIGPWIARHLVDLDAPKNSNPSDPQYPGAGLVAHLLWGSGPSKSQAQRAQAFAERVVARLDNKEERADAPAPPKDQIKGSDKNEPGSASNKTGGIEINDATETALQNKVTEHNKKMADGDRPNWTRVRLGALKAVYRRGAGAYSTSHRPGIGRAQWAMARVNAFLVLARTGRPANPKYVGDNDLLHPEHPKYSKGS